jgi:hypothetical protein
MLYRSRILSAVLATFVVAGLSGVATAAPVKAKEDATGLTKGTVKLESAGPLAFAPKGILLVGDPQAAAVYAIDTGDREAGDATQKPRVEGIDEKIASLLGTEKDQIKIADLAVNPISGTTYLSVARGRGAKAVPVLVRVTRAGKLSEQPLTDVMFAKAEITNATEGKQRLESITHLAFYKDRVWVAGLSNEEFASKLRSIPFPFAKADKGTSIEIFHGAHGKLETRSPVRVFVPYAINGEDHLLAAYTCTPLVTLPIKQLEPDIKIKGTTVAELGNRNRPLSMIVYRKGDKDYVLMANSARGLMKIPLAGIDKIEGISKRIADKAGLEYETVKERTGVQKLDAFGKDQAVVLVQAKGKMDLETIDLP